MQSDGFKVASYSVGVKSGSPPDTRRYMIKWQDIVKGIEELDGLHLNGELAAAVERPGSGLSSPPAGIAIL